MLVVTEFVQQWPIPRQPTKPGWYGLYLCGALALLLYALCKVWFPTIAGAAGGIALAVGGILFFTMPRLRLSPWSLLLLLCFMVQLCTWQSAMLTHPEWSSHQPTLDRLGKLFFFLPLTILLAGQLRHVLLCWGLFGAGLVLAVVTYSGGWAYWQGALAGARVDFGMRNAQHTAMYFGVFLLMLTTLARLWLCPGGVLSRWRLLPWGFAVLISLLMLYITQTRAVLLGLLLTFILMSLLVAAIKLYRGHVSKRLLLSLLLLLGVALPLTEKALDVLQLRTASEQQTMTLLLQGKWQQLPDTSMGIRLQTWLEAVDRIKERPLLGWGDGARSEVIKHSATLSDEVKQEYGHLHNYFLEIQLSYGLVGSLFLCALFGLLLRTIYRAWRQGLLEDEFALFGLGFVVFWLFINTFESYLSFNSGVFVFALVCAGLLSRPLLATAPSKVLSFAPDAPPAGARP